MSPFFEIRQVCSKSMSIMIAGKKILSLPACFKRFKKTNKKPKFGVSYSVFDGEELLEASIKSIRSEVDYINVVAQTTSWHGNKYDGCLKVIEDLVKKKLIDEVIFFEPNLKLSPQINEIKKRNLGLKSAIKAEVNYFMTMDVDEFYRKDELSEAKKVILDKKITHSYCKQILYQRPTTRILEHYEGGNIQFFSKIDKYSKLGDNELAVCLVDPTRKILERKNSKHFFLNQASMHHFTSVRKNINQKYVNSSFPVAFREHQIRETIEVKDEFNITPYLE